MLTLAIYIVIGGAGITLLAFLFNLTGKKEEEASPQFAWKKAVEEYGDPTIVNLYQKAKSDKERMEIADFVKGELAKRLPKSEPTSTFDIEDTFISATRDKSINYAEESVQEEIPNENLSVNNIFSAPAYRFWQDPAVSDIQAEPVIQTIEELELENENVGTENPPEPIYKNFGQELESDRQTDLIDRETQNYCTICGNPLEPDCDFCIICGTKVIIETPAQVETIEDAVNPEQKMPGLGIDRTVEPDLAEESSVDDYISIPPSQERLRQCPVCGEPIEDNNDFCIFCGSSVLADFQTADQSDINPFAMPAPNESPRYSSEHFSDSEDNAAEEDPFANTSINLKAEEKESPVTQSTISLQDILNNVRALEERIFAEATGTNQNNQAPNNKGNASK